MKPAPFKYVSVASEEELVAALASHGGEARLLAGGQSLVPMMNFRVAEPAVLIDINRVQELDFILIGADAIEIGALTRQATLEDSEELAARFPIVREVTRHIAHRAVRNRGTIGGSLALAYPGAELPLLAVTLGGEIWLRSPHGERKVPAAAFILGALDTVLTETEYVRSLRLPLPRRSAAAAFTEISRRHGDFAIAASLAAVDRGDDGRPAQVMAGVTGGTGAPIRLQTLESELASKSATQSDIAELVHTAIASIEVEGDQHYPEEFRRQLLRTALLRALTTALSHAEQRHVH